MQRIKYIIILLIFGYAAQACSLKQYHYCEIALGRKCILSEKQITAQQNSELPAFKRKFKNKGVQVFLPQIHTVVFTRINIPDEFKCLDVISQPSYKIDYVQRKRGPPALLS